MKTSLTYDKAFSELEKIVTEIEGDDVQLDLLVDKIKQAKQLIEFCENKLRSVESETEQLLGDKLSKKQKKN